jgi:ubiquinone/menaquinone biosynthesis C-methylase UbiE
MTDDARDRVTRAYNAAADRYDDPANAFWGRFGARTIERIGLSPGSRVLDACCGSGASAIPAAQAVAPGGSVIGIDVSDNLLELGRRKASAAGLRNLQFRHGDMLNLDLPEAPFDAVVCVFGIFFAPDMVAAVRELWRVVTPGGVLAITTWGPRWFEPAVSVFWNAVRDVRPDLYKAFNPWDRITNPSSVAALLQDAGISDGHAVAEAGHHPIESPDAWWAAMLGSGTRGTIDQLSAQDLERVRRTNLEYIATSGVTSVEANVVYALARKA